MASIQHEGSMCPALNTTLGVMPRLGLIYPSTRLNAGATAPIPTDCLFQWSCKIQQFQIIAILKIKPSKLHTKATIELNQFGQGHLAQLPVEFCCCVDRCQLKLHWMKINNNNNNNNKTEIL